MASSIRSSDNRGQLIKTQYKIASPVTPTHPGSLKHPQDVDQVYFIDTNNGCSLLVREDAWEESRAPRVSLDVF
jgi:hypothetical protein